MKIVVVAAVSRNGYIGKGNKLPWRIPDEMKHFHETISGKALVVGHRTFLSLPKKMQQHHPMFVVSRVSGQDLFNLVRFAKEQGHEELYIIGGAYVYEQAIPMADELIISYIHKDVDGDVKLPEIHYAKWKANKVNNNKEFTTIWWKRQNATIPKRST